MRHFLLILGFILLGTLGTAHASHAVFDFVANRTLAHELRGDGLLIRAGAPGFAKYVHFSRPLSTWRLRQLEDNRPVALAQTQAVLEVPLTASEARTARVVLRLKSQVPQTIRVSHAGHASAAIPLKVGWQTVTVPLESLSAGENKLMLGFAQSGKFGTQKASAAVEWILIGGGTPPTDEGAAPVVSDKGITLGKDDGLAYYVQVPLGGAIASDGDTGGCIVTANGKPLPLDLSAQQGKIVRLELRAGGGSCVRTNLRASLTTSGEDAQVSYVKRPRNIIFWMTDDTRSDKYRVYNPKTRVETPVMDALTKKSTLFQVHYVQGNESRVSHASLWTSLYPAQHHFISEKAKLDPKFVTLADAVKPSGLTTVGLMANGFIDAFWGFGKGWDILHNYIHESGGLKAEDLVRAARGYFTTHAKDPSFVYLGTIDAHVSWRAHQPWIGRYDTEPYSGPFVKACLDPQLDQIVAGKLHVTERDKTRIIALYDSDVSYNDQQLGELMKSIAASGHEDDTMLIMTADHGEELWDHGRIGHGQSLREELVHVPLLIHYPPLFPAGHAVSEGVELIDLLPTITDALGLKAPTDAQGESLIPLAQGVGAGYPRPAIASQYELAYTMRLGHYKLWVGGSGDVRLFDAAADPGEAHELSVEKPTERRFVTDALSIWMAYQSKWKKSRWGVASNHKPALATDLEKHD